MASTIITKNSSTASATPAVGDLQQGELAVNVTDKKVYTKDSSAAIVKLVGSLGNQEASAVAITGGSIAGITDLAVADGGTGSSTAAGARSNLSAAASGANSDITSLSGLTTALSVAQGGTGVTSSTGSGSVVLSNSPTLVTPALGTPSAAVLTNATGLPLSTGISGLGTGVATFLGTPSSANLLAAVTDETGTGALVFANSPTLVTPALGTPASATLTNATGLPIGTGVSGLGTGVATALAVNVGSAGAPVVNGGVLGTPSSGTLTNATGLPISTGVSGLGTGVATALAVNVGSAGAPVVNGGALGTPSSGTVTNLTGTASININGTVGATTPTTGAFTTLAASSSVTLSGGTANGVTYLNGSKVLTSGSALTFDGTTFVAPFTSLSGNGVVLTVDRTGTGGNDRTNVQFSNSGTVRGGIGTVGASDGIYFNQGTTEGMRLTSTGLGIGTSSPNTTLEANKAITFTSIDTFGQFIVKAASGATGQLLNFGVDTTAGISFIQSVNRGTNATDLVLQRYGGNLGLCVTPSAWTTWSSVLQGNSYALTGYNNSGNVQSALWTNAYNGSGGVTYYSNGYATQYKQYNGNHAWSTAASGTAGTAITFTQAMTLDASGNLGIGTTSPSTKLQVNDTITIGTADKAIQWLNSGTALADIRADSSSNIIFRNTSSYTERARITAAGKLYVNTTNGFIGLTNIKVDIGGRYNSGISGVGSYSFGAADSGGAFVINDTGNGSTEVERARIDSSGNLLVGQTSQAVAGFSSGKIVTSVSTQAFVGLASSSSGAVFCATTPTDGYPAYFYNSTTSTAVGYIRLAASSTTYATSSDYRLKENIAPMTGALTKVAQLKPCTYTWKVDGAFGQGFIAHELAEVVPECVVGEKDAIDEEGNPKYQGIDTSFLVATLTAALQELNAKFEAYVASHP